MQRPRIRSISFRESRRREIISPPMRPLRPDYSDEGSSFYVCYSVSSRCLLIRRWLENYNWKGLTFSSAPSAHKLGIFMPPSRHPMKKHICSCCTIELVNTRTWNIRSPGKSSFAKIFRNLSIQPTVFHLAQLSSRESISFRSRQLHARRAPR